MSEREEKKLTAIKAIRAKCIDCSGGSKQEVQQCVVKDCPLYRYRMGKNPNISRKEMTEEQKQALRVRLARALGKEE